MTNTRKDELKCFGGEFGVKMAEIDTEDTTLIVKKKIILETEVLCVKSLTNGIIAQTVNEGYYLINLSNLSCFRVADNFSNGLGMCNLMPHLVVIKEEGQIAIWETQGPRSLTDRYFHRGKDSAEVYRYH